MLRGLPIFTKQLKKAGFNIVNVANNHLQEYGKEAALDSINNLKEEDFKIIGIDSFQPQIILIKDIRFGFLGYSLHPEQSICEEVIYSQGNLKKIISDVKKIRGKVNYLIISLHWGDEYVENPSKEQILLAHKLIDAGVDIILGHHPHVLQNIEKYKNGIIVYSLGNFISDMHPKRTKKSCIFKVKFTKNFIKEFDIVPVYIGKKYQPRLVKNKNTKKSIQEIYKTPVILTEEQYKESIKTYRKQLRIEWFIFLIKNCCKLPKKYLLEYIFLFIKTKLFKNKCKI